MPKYLDKKEGQKVIEELVALGLSEKEARVYFVLLPWRDVGTSKIVLATGLHSQFVYLSLDRLEKLGLVKYVIQKGRRKYSANTPSRLLSLVEEKKLLAQHAARELASRFAGEHEQDFEVFQGDSAFVAHEFMQIEQANEGSSIDVIGGTGDRFFITLGSDVDEYERVRKEKNITVRYIGAEPQRISLEKMAQERKDFSFRIFPGLSTGLVNTNIREDSVTFNIFGEPVLAFTLRNKAVSESHHHFFEGLWNVSQ